MDWRGAAVGLGFDVRLICQREVYGSGLRVWFTCQVYVSGLRVRFTCRVYGSLLQVLFTGQVFVSGQVYGLWTCQLDTVGLTGPVYWWSLRGRFMGRVYEVGLRHIHAINNLQLRS